MDPRLPLPQGPRAAPDLRIEREYRDWSGENYPDLALELAQEQGDDHDEGEAREAGQHDEDGLLQPAGPVRAW